MPIDPLIVDFTKVLLGAAGGGLATYLVTRHQAAQRKILHVDVIGPTELGGWSDTLNITINFEDEKFDFLKIFAFTVENKGTDFVEMIQLYFWDKDEGREDWFVKFFKSSAANLPSKDANFRSGFLEVTIDHLNPGEKDDFIVIANCEVNPSVSCRTKGVKLVDLREQRKKAARVGTKLLKFLAPF